MPTQASPRISLVGLLPGREPRALAHRVADVAEHEQIADRGAGEPDGILRLAGNETAREAFEIARGAGRVSHGLFDLLGEFGLDLHVLRTRQFEEAAGKVGVIGRERVLDLALGDRRVEALGDRPVGDRHRIVRDRDQLSGLDRQRHDRQRRDRRGHSHGERHYDLHSGHRAIFSATQFYQVVLNNCADKMPLWEN